MHGKLVSLMERFALASSTLKSEYDDTSSVTYACFMAQANFEQRKNRSL